MYENIEQFFSENKSVLIDGELRPVVSYNKDAEKYISKLVKTYIDNDSPESLTLQQIADGLGTNGITNVVKTESPLTWIGLGLIEDSNDGLTKDDPNHKYRLTEDFKFLADIGIVPGVHILNRMYNLRNLENNTKFTNLLLCTLREGYLKGEIIDFPRDNNLYRSTVPLDAREVYAERINKIYGYGATPDDAPYASQRAINNLAKLELIRQQGETKEGFNTYVLTEYAHRLLETINANLSECVKSNPIKTTLLNLPLQQIFYGAPGTGKSFYVDNMTTDENSIRTTFHPDSDYASFVGAYKPVMEETTMRVVPVVLGNGTSFKQNEGTYSEKRISYKFVPQAFLKAYCNAWKNQSDPYYLVIEEINRGNCAQIFGDLFQLLDRNKQGYSAYAIDADEDIRRFICEEGKEYLLSGEQIDDVWNDDHTKLIAKGEDIAKGVKLVLPNNLRIWATMNTSDQSLFPIDSAFKRRWEWEYMPIKYGNLDWKIEIGEKKYSWVEFQKEINNRVFVATESEDKQLGDYFVKADENNIISSKLLLNKVIFYLWNDVCKDGDGDIFKINTDLDYSKELDSSKNEDITFSKFFKGTDLKLQQWMRYLGIKPDSEKTAEN